MGIFFIEVLKPGEGTNMRYGMKKAVYDALMSSIEEPKMAQIVQVYDTANPDCQHNIQSLMLSLDGPIDVYLPNGKLVQGILKDIQGIYGSPIVKAIIEIEDEYATFYYVNHRPGEMAQIYN